MDASGDDPARAVVSLQGTTSATGAMASAGAAGPGEVAAVTSAGAAMTAVLPTLAALAAALAHEINNPLAAVSANLDFVMEALGPAIAAPSEQRTGALVEALLDVRRGADRLRKVSADLGILGQLDPSAPSRPDGERRATALRPAVESALQLCGHELRRRARLVKELHEVPRVYAAEPGLRLVLVHLLVSAARRIPEGAPDEHRIHVACRLDARGRVELTVRDTGPAIASAVLPALLDPFADGRLFRDGRDGSALRLCICLGVVAAAGGELSIESRAGGGALFRLSLPAAPDPGRSVV